MRYAPDRLLQTATEIFAQRGFDGTSLREIADSAGFSFQLIAYHFGSKEDLWRACVRNLYATRFKAIAIAEKQIDEMSPDTWLRRWMRTGLLFSIEDPQLRHMLFHEYFKKEKRYDEVVLPIRRELIQSQSQAFRTAHRRGAIRCISHTEASFLYASVLLANASFPYELEQTIGLPRTQPDFIEYQVDLLSSIYKSGRGIDRFRRKRAGALRQRQPTAPPVDAPLELSTLLQSDPLARRPRRGSHARHLLIHAAVAAFSRVGFEGASMREIAKAAGIVHPLVGYHFGSKEDLWEAAIDEVLDRKLNFVRSIEISDDGDRRIQLRKHMQSALEDAANNPELRRILALEWFSQSSRYKTRLEPKIDRLLGASRSLYEKISTAGLITHFSAREVQFLFQSVVGVNAMAPDDIRMEIGRIGTKRTPLDWQTDLLTHLFLDGTGVQSRKRTTKTRRKI